MKLEIDDFSRFIEEEGKLEEDLPNCDEVHEIYRKKIAALQNECQEIVKNVREEGIKEGKKAAQEECQKKLAEEITRCKEKAQQEHEKIYEEIWRRVETIETDLRKELRNYFHAVASLISENIVDIFEYLYITPENAENIGLKLQNIIEEFGEYTPQKIKVGKGLYEFLRDRLNMIDVEKDEKLSENDFKIMYDKFIIEGDIKKKLQALKDELQRALTNAS